MSGRYFAGCAQCGKLNQNIKIAAKVRDELGEPLYFLRTGQRMADFQRGDAETRRRGDFREEAGPVF
jgi:hypothetical protein